MEHKKNIKIPLTAAEKQQLRRHKINIQNLSNYTATELETLLVVSPERAKKIYALIAFQIIPSIGIKFAEDLVSMGYYAITELKGKDGATLTNQFELLKGYWIDPCVEDQFRLAVYYAETGDCSKNWWDFTAERKKFRAEYGYPEARPKVGWYEYVVLK